MAETETQLVQWTKLRSSIAELATREIALLSTEDSMSMSKMNYSLDAVIAWGKANGIKVESINDMQESKLLLNRTQGMWIEANIPEDGQLKQGDIFPVTKNSHGAITLLEIGINRNDSPKFRVLARLPLKKIEDYIALRKEEIVEININDACRLFKGAHVSHNSGENEWYTPEIFVEAARAVMGSIDTDPASTDIANQVIKADRYFTIENDGLQNEWHGNVWMNPPYSQPLITEFCNLLVNKLGTHEITQACVLVNNATETNFYQNMLSGASAVCFIKGRVKFLDKDGNNTGAPLQGQTILYFGENKALFAEYFNNFGVVLYA